MTVPSQIQSPLPSTAGEKWKDHFETGKYVCSDCGNDLFTSRAKYEHDSPWPAFSETIHQDSVAKVD